MKIRFSCANCQKKYSARAEQAGRIGKCKNCGAEIIVPTTAEEHSFSQADQQDHKDKPAVPPLPRLLRWITKNPARAAVLVFTVLMLYQAALPSGLTLDPVARTITWNIIPTDTFSISKADVIGNVVPYFIFGHFVFLASWHRRRSWKPVLCMTFAGTIAMAFSVEVVQYFNPDRGSAMWDIISGIIGGFLALGTGALHVTLISGRLKRWVNTEVRQNPLIGAAALLALVICWDAARPFYVISSANALFDNIKYSNLIPFAPPGRDIRDQLGLREVPSSVEAQPVESSVDYLGSLAERLISYTVLFGLLIMGRLKQRKKEALRLYFAVIFLAELISLGIVHGGSDITNIAIAVIALPFALFGVHISSQQPKLGLTMLLAIFLFYIFISDLRPYVFGSMEELSVSHFVPLLAHVQTTDVMMLANIVEAVAVYAPLGMLIYFSVSRPKDIIGQPKWPSLFWPCLVCGGLGLTMEIVQLWIPARTSSIEDVIYATLGGYGGASAARLFYHYTLSPRPISSKITDGHRKKVLGLRVQG